MTKTRNNKQVNPIKKYGTWVLVIALMITQALSLIYIFKLHQSVSSIEDRLFLNFVNQSETLRYKRAAVSVSEQKIYIPDARIYVTLGDSDPEIMYDARQLSSGAMGALHLSTATTVGNQRSLTENETCDKLITISASKQSQGTFIKEIPSTKDGLRYIYLYDKNTCDLYTDETWNDTKQIAEGIHSY